MRRSVRGFKREWEMDKRGKEMRMGRYIKRFERGWGWEMNKRGKRDKDGEIHKMV